LLPAGRAAARHHGAVRRRRQADLDDGVRLDDRPDQPLVRLVSGERGGKGRLPGTRVPDSARALGAVDRRDGAVDHAGPALDAAPRGILVGHPRAGRYGAAVLPAAAAGAREWAATKALT